MSDVGVTIDDWTDDEIRASHRCEGIKSAEVGVLSRTNRVTGVSGWILANIDPATEDDVKKGVAPQLGVPSRCLALVAVWDHVPDADEILHARIKDG